MANTVGDQSRRYLASHATIVLVETSAWGNVLMAFGGSVAKAHKARGADKRPVLGAWPGLTRDQLNQGRDLRHTTGFRDVLAEAVGVHLGNTQLATVLPNYKVKKVGFVA